MRVAVIARNASAAIVEWRDEDGPHRVTLPDELVSGNIDIETLEQGAPYGAMWESFDSLAVTPAIVARALREAGVWTENDLRKNVKRARAAALGIANEMVAALLRLTREV